jgi:Holliday junction DNA helicase RuvA
MIIWLEGRIKLKTESFVVLRVGGVGYQVFVSFATIKKLPKSGQRVGLWTYFYCRENVFELYGFLNYPELEFFKRIIQISGVGPKIGLAVLATASVDKLKENISLGNVSYLTQISGIGRMLAEKIVVELKDKLGKPGGALELERFRAEEDALEALRSLGYSLKESRQALARVPAGTKGVENIIKEALKNVSRQR